MTSHVAILQRIALVFGVLLVGVWIATSQLVLTGGGSTLAYSANIIGVSRK